MGRRKIYDREGWMSRIKIKLHGLDSKKRTLLKLDEDLLEMSERIAGEGIGSFDYTSQKENIEESFLGMEVLKTYIEDVDKKFEEINEAFKKSVSKNAVEEISKIKMEDFKVANNLGIKNYQTVSSPMTGERRIEYDKKEIGLSDFMGIYEDRVGSYVEEFALVFEEQYKGAETEDVRDYLREYYKAGEFDYKMYQPEKQMWSDVADIVSLGILPLGEALFGWNPITGESLTDTERGSKMLEGIVSLIPVGAAIKTVGKGGKLLLKTTAKLYVSECVTGLSMYGANYAGEKAGLPPELQAVLSFTAGATVAKISSDALFKPGGLGIIDDVAEGASGTKTIDFKDYQKIDTASRHNIGKDKVMLGKYDGGSSNSYISKAGSDFEYFDLGKDWDVIKGKYDFTDDDMFKLFNESFLEEGINSGKTFHFSHNPIGDAGALGQEYQYLLQNNYKWDPSTMTMKPKY